MGDLIQFRPRPRDAVEIANVQIIGAAPHCAPHALPGAQVYDDTAPAEYCGQVVDHD